MLQVTVVVPPHAATLAVVQLTVIAPSSGGVRVVQLRVVVPPQVAAFAVVVESVPAAESCHETAQTLVSGANFWARSAPCFELDPFKGVLGPTLAKARPKIAK